MAHSIHYLCKLRRTSRLYSLPCRWFKHDQHVFGKSPFVHFTFLKHKNFKHKCWFHVQYSFVAFYLRRLVTGVNFGKIKDLNPFVRVFLHKKDKKNFENCVLFYTSTTLSWKRLTIHALKMCRTVLSSDGKVFSFFQR